MRNFTARLLALITLCMNAHAMEEVNSEKKDILFSLINDGKQFNRKESSVYLTWHKKKEYFSIGLQDSKICTGKVHANYKQEQGIIEIYINFNKVYSDKNVLHSLQTLMGICRTSYCEAQLLPTTKFFVDSQINPQISHPILEILNFQLIRNNTCFGVYVRYLDLERHPVYGKLNFKLVDNSGYQDPLPSFIQNYFFKHFENSNPNIRMLGIGSGNGLFELWSAQFLHCGSVVIATDLNHNNINHINLFKEETNSAYQKKILQNVEAITENALKLPENNRISEVVAQGGFDIVTVFNLMHYLTPFEQIKLNEMISTFLKPEGKVYFINNIDKPVKKLDADTICFMKNVTDKKIVLDRNSQEKFSLTVIAIRKDEILKFLKKELNIDCNYINPFCLGMKKDALTIVNYTEENKLKEIANYCGLKNVDEQVINEEINNQIYYDKRFSVYEKKESVNIEKINELIAQAIKVDNDLETLGRGWNFKQTLEYPFIKFKKK